MQYSEFHRCADICFLLGISVSGIAVKQTNRHSCDDIKTRKAAFAAVFAVRSVVACAYIHDF